MSGWIPNTANTVSELDDVDLTGLADDDFLQWDDALGVWVPVAGGAVSDLDDLSDVDLTGLADGDFLQYDSGSSMWLPVPEPSGGGSLSEGIPIVDGNTTAYGIPGARITIIDSGTFAVDLIRYTPFVIRESIDVANMIAFTISGASAGRALRLGIYEADNDNQPTDLIAEGEVSSATNGLKTLAVSVTLPAGRYVMAACSNHATPTYRRWRVGTLTVDPTVAEFALTYEVANSYGAFPSTGVRWDTESFATTNGLIGYSVLETALT